MNLFSAIGITPFALPNSNFLNVFGIIFSCLFIVSNLALFLLIHADTPTQNEEIENGQSRVYTQLNSKLGFLPSPASPDLRPAASALLPSDRACFAGRKSGAPGLAKFPIFEFTCVYEMAIATMFYNEAPYLKEWIEYHHLAGVDHFWMYNNNSTDHWQEVLQPYITEKLVEVIDWPSPPGSPYPGYQVMAFQDAFVRARGMSTWVACIDIDEFIVPMVNCSISECLNTYFSQASGIYVNWRNFGTGGIHIANKQSLLFHLTAASTPTHSENAVGKSIVRPETVNIIDMWYPHHFPLKHGHDYVNGEGQKMTFIGIDLPTSGQHFDKFIRINHYPFRDEGFYRNMRLAKAKAGFGDLNLILKHYDEFSAVQEYSIIDFILKTFPFEAQKTWKGF